MSTEPDELGFNLPPPAKASRVMVLVAIAVVVGGAFAFGYLRQRKAHGETPVATAKADAPRVEVMKPVVLSSDRALALPGTVRALEETKIYARVTGYVRS
ncbi:MAG: efflux RND transporter periplasmic adaptor subunit, partial [Myxococcales bacterium]|nr:efflux RND transporter periplasmic adaptor subunit [Myxococcales bacterium]